MKAIRCGRGLGDSLYLQAVVRHLVSQGHELIALTDYPDVFRPLEGKVKIEPFRRDRTQMTAHYVGGKSREGTTQFDDCCTSAGIQGPVDLKLDWPKAKGPLIDRLLSPGKPVLCVQLPRYPMGREDGFGMELLPDCNAIQGLIDKLAGQCTVVQIGAGQALHQFSGIDIDLANKTTVSELIDVASVASGFIGYCSFLLPLSESLDKPALFVWARKGLKSATQFIKTITPEKLLHKKTSLWVCDDWEENSVEVVLNEFRKLLTSR